MFDYSKLRGRIKEKAGSETKFAPTVDMTPASLSSKLNQKTDFTSIEIQKMCKELDIPILEISDYFFVEKLELNSRNENAAQHK